MNRQCAQELEHTQQELMELLGGFELPPPSLPTDWKPSSHCVSMLSGPFFPKNEVSSTVWSIVSVCSFPREGQRVGQDNSSYPE